MSRRCLILAAIIACVVLLLGNDTILARADDQPKPPERAEQQSSLLDPQKSPDDISEGPEGYHPEGRRVGTPTDVDRDLDFSFPKRDYILPRLLPQKWFKGKEDLCENYGLKLGFSYQAIYQKASDTTPTSDDEVAAGWALLEGKWEVLNCGKDFEGSLVAALDCRHTFTDVNNPAAWGTIDVGSLWLIDFNLFYADKPEDNPIPGFPSESGWGLKVLGEKQMGRLVGFGSYTYNTAEGGAFGATFAKHATTAGLAVLKPFGLRGEIGLGTSWA